MLIYHFDSRTGELTESGTADPNPRQPGQYLIPAHATTVAPPEAGEHEKAVFVDGAWSLTPDYRGTTWFRPDGSKYEITDLGIAPDPRDSGTQPVPVLTVAQTREARINELANYRFLKESAGITVNGVAVRTDRESQSLINGALRLFDLDPSVATINWKGENGWAQIDKATLEAIGRAVGAHVQSCFTNELSHADAINALTTRKAVQDYDFTAGWPA